MFYSIEDRKPLLDHEILQLCAINDRMISRS